MTKPCEGLRVLDFSLGMTGNLATMILGDFGADVIKVEPPGGDPWRDEPAWAFWNRGKRTTAIDLKTAAGQERALALARDADAVLVAFRPGVAERLGIGYGAVAKANPAAVYCSITGFGPRGPFAQIKGYEGIVNARTGRQLEFGGIASRSGPGYSAVASAGTGATHGAVQGILAALHRRRATGLGALVETSLLQGNTAYDMIRWYAIQRESTDEIAKDRAQNWGALVHQVPRPNYLCAVTKDGVWLQFANTMPHLFMAQMVALGLTHLYEDPRWADLPGLKNAEDSEGVWEAVLDCVRQKTWAEWKDDLYREKDVAVEPIVTTEEAFDHPQVRFNGHVVEVGGKEQPGVLANMPATPGEPQGPATAIAGNAAWRPRQGAVALPAEKPAAAGAAASAPLTGTLVVDLATYYAAPFGTALLADYGARVIKVEPPEGEYSRYVAGNMLKFKTTAGKESLAVDMKTPEGREIVRKIIPKADILLHNFRPGATERLGIGYEEVKKLNPDIVYHYGGSYGPEGPYSFKPAFHPSAGAIAGNAHIQMPPAAISPEDGQLPMEKLKRLAWRMLQANEGNPDVNAALNVGSALMLGLQARGEHGIGQSQFTTMICGNLYANGDAAIRYAGKPPRPEPDIDLYGLNALYRLYECAGHSWVFIACPQEKEWQALCRTLGHPEWLSDSRFDTRAARSEHDSQLITLIAGVLAGRHATVWERDLTAAGAGCGRADAANVARFAMEEPSNRELGFAVPVSHQTHGDYFRHGPLMTIAGAASTPGAMCEVGEHTRPLLRELGYSDAQIDDLRDRRIVACYGE